jgi:SH3-like domain-containing protein
MAAVGLALGSNAARARDAQRAVVIEGVAVRAEPTSEGRVLFRLPAGAVVQDEEHREDWRLVETSAGARGWVPMIQVRAAGS